MSKPINDPATENYLNWVTEEVGHKLNFVPTGPFTARASGKPEPEQGIKEFYERNFTAGYFVTARQGVGDRTKMDNFKLVQALHQSIQKMGVGIPEICSTTKGLWISEATLRDVMAKDKIDESTLADESPTRLGQHLSALLYPEKQRA